MLRFSALLTSGALLVSACTRPPDTPVPAPLPPPPAVAAAGVHHVVVVTFDGLRPDAISEADTPRVARLLREGAASLASRVPPPPLTLPSHFTMATGQTAAGHGILTNKTLDHEVANVTLFTAAHAAGRRTGLYYGKAKLIALAPRGSADVVAGPASGDRDWEAGASANLAAKFVRDFARERFGLAWVHLREADMAGHDAGWMTPPYRTALVEADRALGAVLDAIAASGLPTTVILTADHGGEGKDHWSHEVLDSIVPWICKGPFATPGARIAASSIADVGPTAAALLGISLPEVEGRAVKECLPGA